MEVAEKAGAKINKLEGWLVAHQNIPDVKKYIYKEFPEAFT